MTSRTTRAPPLLRFVLVLLVPLSLSCFFLGPVLDVPLPLLSFLCLPFDSTPFLTKQIGIELGRPFCIPRNRGGYVM
jgi:hypothetical protein